GLSRDARLMADILEQAGFETRVTAIRRGKLHKWFQPPLQRLKFAWKRSLRSNPCAFDAILMLERVRGEYLPFARKNLFSPNPDWCAPADVALLSKIDTVLTKTRHAEAIFQQLGCRTA